MKFALLFLSAFVVLSHQQFTHPRGLVWVSPYVPSKQPILHQYHQAVYYGLNEDVDGRALRRRYRPQSIPLSYLQNEELATSSQDVDEEQLEVLGGESKIRGVDNGERFLYSSVINNPFYKTATFTITSTVTTLGSVVICVPANNLVAVPSPTCAGRKKRELEDDSQFPIVPSVTLSLMPTAISSADKGVALGTTTDQQNSRGLFSSKDEVADSSESSLEDEQNGNVREKRLLGSGAAASTTLTSYSFVAATATSTVLLDPTGMNLAACLPAGYVVC